ncbi:catechol oxidase [Salvia divinorum]|uniref:Catechol oxidase n=1 Tax=Salvia divinorum TaxID=28513 RepID=A0ABD1G246_SALDI
MHRHQCKHPRRSTGRVRWGFTQLLHRVKAKESTGNLRLNLKELYENINIADDDRVVVTIVPTINGGAVTIGVIKIIPRVD